MQGPMAICSSDSGCLVANSEYACWPNTPMRQSLRVGSWLVNGLPVSGPESGIDVGRVVAVGAAVVEGGVGVEVVATDATVVVETEPVPAATVVDVVEAAPAVVDVAATRSFVVVAELALAVVVTAS